MDHTRLSMLFRLRDAMKILVESGRVKYQAELDSINKEIDDEIKNVHEQDKKNAA